jgi:hypothetical protein
MFIEMIFKLPKKERKEKAIKLADYFVIAKSKENAKKKLKRFLGKKKFEKVTKEK